MTVVPWAHQAIWSDCLRASKRPPLNAFTAGLAFSLVYAQRIVLMQYPESQPINDAIVSLVRELKKVA